MENPNNRIVAAGMLEDSLTLSHEVMNEPFYAGTLLVKRLSGAVDRLPVTIPGKLLAINEMDGQRESGLTGQLLLVTGQVRSYNKVVEGSGRLMVTLFVQSMTPQAPKSNSEFGRGACGVMFCTNSVTINRPLPSTTLL